MNKKLLVAAAALLAGTVVARAEIVEQILVKVNGDIFTKTELEQRQIQVLRQRGQQMDLKADANNQQLRKALDEITPAIIVDVVNEMVVVQRGKELGYTLSNEQFNSVVENIKKENKIETEEQFQAALKAENMTMADLRRNLERSMIRQRVEQNEVIGKIGVNDADARAYYDTHLSEFTTPPTVTLREILVAIPGDSRGVNAAAADDAKAKAEDIRQRVTSGKETFERLASQLSDSPSKANSGLIGPLSVQDVSADLRKIVDTLKPGEVSAPIRNARGYQLLKLETKTDAQTMPFEQARDQISERVFTDKRKAEYLKYLDKLRSQAIIEWKNEDIKKAFEQGLKQQAGALAQ
ncbi:MAG TPA: peptidyl-prolyl cis-trans isomerase [Vicinamibacterales bacterium]|jgi:peptidyl-prolyl cis-trans isomerase SurA